MATLTLYGRTSSSNVQKVLWLFQELGLQYKRIDAGRSYPLNSTNPEYLALNPNGLVPTLDDNGFILWESNAILRYVANAYAPDSAIYPRDNHQRALVEQWIEWGTPVMSTIGNIFKGLIRTPPEQRDMKQINDGVASVNKSLKIWDAALTKSGTPYIVGSNLTIADIALGAGMYRWYNLQIERLDLPHVEQWYKRLLEKEGFKAHVVQDLV